MTVTSVRTCFYQLYSTFILQGFHLKAEYGGLIIPAAWPSLCEIVILLILVPVMERGIYPSLAKCGCSIPILLKVIIGMLLAVGSAGMGRYSILHSKAIQTYFITLRKLRNDLKIKKGYINQINIYVEETLRMWRPPGGAGGGGTWIFLGKGVPLVLWYPYPILDYVQLHFLTLL